MCVLVIFFLFLGSLTTLHSCLETASRSCFSAVWAIFSIKPIFHCDAKPLGLGVRFGHYPQCENFAFGMPTCRYVKSLEFALPQRKTLNFALPPTATPNASRWNIVGVGSPTQGAGIGHVDIMLFMHLFPRWQREN